LAAVESQREPLDEAAVVAAVGEEMAAVLRSAHQAAQEVRHKAAADAARILDEARQKATADAAEAEAVLGEARAHVERLVAETTATATAEAAAILDSARQEAAEQVATATGEAEQRRESVAREAEQCLAGARAEAEDLLTRARAEAVALKTEAEREGRLTVDGAQAARERILADLTRRRRIATVQIEQLRAGRERLLESYAVVRRTLEEVNDEFHRADAEARAAAEEAGRQVASELGVAPGVDAVERPTTGAGDTAAEAGDTAAEAGDTAAEAGDTAAEAGDTAAEAGDTAAEAGDTAAEAGEPGDAGRVAVRPGDLPATEPAEVASGRPAGDPAGIESAGIESAGIESDGEERSGGDEGGEEGPQPDEGGGQPEGEGPAGEQSMGADPVGEGPVGEGPVGEQSMGADPAGEAAEGEDPTGGESAAGVVAGADRATPSGARPTPVAPTPLHGATGPGPVPGQGDGELSAWRDEVTGAIYADLARRLKRALQDDQNELLDRLRSGGRPVVAGTLLSPLDDSEQRYAALATPFLTRAAVEGAELAARLGGTDVGDESPPDPLDGRPELGALASSLAGEVLSPLRRRLADLLAELGDDELDAVADAIGSVFREAKARRIESAARDQVGAAFAFGTWAAVSPGARVRWVAAEDDRCADCEDNTLAGDVGAGEVFPTGQLHPPAHSGCRCLLVPAGPPD